MKNPRFLLQLLGGALFLASILFSPVFIAFALKDSKLESSGKEVAGEVVSHQNTVKYQRPIYYATVTYKINGTDYFVKIKGVGANPIRLPIGANVKVLYLPDDPGFSRVSIPEAASGEPPPWQIIPALWSAAIIFFATARYLRPNPSFQRTASGGR